MRLHTLLTVLGIAGITACDEQAANTAPRSGGQLSVSAARTVGATDPTATWKYPLNDAALAVRSDHLYSDGANSVYANGICNVATTIFATTEHSNSGDATLSTGGSGKCLRHFTFVYPDGVTETTPSFNNLRGIENTTYSIPVGSTVERQLHMGTDVVPNVGSRCGGLIWGYGVANDIAAGSDSVLVTRLDASTWHVQSQDAPHNKAYCKNTGQLFAMPVDFTVISSRPLP